MCCCVTHGIVCSLVSWMGAKQLLRVPHAFNMMLIAFAFRPKVRIYAPRCSSHGEAPDCFIARSDWFISTRCDPSAPLSFCPLACFATSSSASASRTPHNDSSNKWSAEPYDHGVSTLWCVKRSTAYGIQYSGTFERWAWHGMAWHGLAVLSS